MSYLVIDTAAASSSSYFDQITVLEGVEYAFRFLWCDRSENWLLGIYDQDGTPLAVGIVLKVSWPLMRRFQDPRLPPGVLSCLDTGGQDLDIQSPGDLGSRVLLMYVTSDDPELQPGGALA